MTLPAVGHQPYSCHLLHRLTGPCPQLFVRWALTLPTSSCMRSLSQSSQAACQVRAAGCTLPTAGRYTLLNPSTAAFQAAATAPALEAAGELPVRSHAPMHPCTHAVCGGLAGLSMLACDVTHTLTHPCQHNLLCHMRQAPRWRRPPSRHGCWPCWPCSPHLGGKRCAASTALGQQLPGTGCVAATRHLPTLAAGCLSGHPECTGCAPGGGAARGVGAP
jgi:hypothetical protein